MRKLIGAASAGIVVLAVASAIALVGATTATAESPPTTPCTEGDANKLFQSPFPHLIGSSCQYRLFWDGQTRTFCERDFIVGGIVYFYDLEGEGISRTEAIAYNEQYVDRVEIDGVEQSLERTAYKHGIHPILGINVLYQQRALITQLPVGDHVSDWENFHPAEGPATATVTLRVLPRTDAACS